MCAEFRPAVDQDDARHFFAFAGLHPSCFADVVPLPPFAFTAHALVLGTPELVVAHFFPFRKEIAAFGTSAVFPGTR